MNYTEFPVFPLITSGKVDSPTDPKARWKLIVSVPTRTLATPHSSISKRARLFGVGGWLVIVWAKKKKVCKKTEVISYELSKGNTSPRIDEFGNVRIRALSKQDWVSLIEVQLPKGQTRNCRYSGAIVESSTAIQIWTKLQ
tara:strand:+ start:444 stop:866 length:423 start_codon:yes stop_codon:yes gene_type:complete